MTDTGTNPITPTGSVSFSQTGAPAASRTTPVHAQRQRRHELLLGHLHADRFRLALGHGHVQPRRCAHGQLDSTPLTINANPTTTAVVLPAEAIRRQARRRPAPRPSPTPAPIRRRRPARSGSRAPIRTERSPRPGTRALCPRPATPRHLLGHLLATRRGRADDRRDLRRRPRPFRRQPRHRAAARSAPTRATRPSRAHPSQPAIGQQTTCTVDRHRSGHAALDADRHGHVRELRADGHVHRRPASAR